MLDPRNSHLDKTKFQLFDPFRSININHLDKSRKQTAENYEDSEEEEEEAEVELKLLESEVGDDSGIHSPPLWKNNYNNNNSPNPLSRRQAIITGQRELMDMVKNIPESCYELSLKDIVQNQQQYLLQQKNDDDDEVVVQVQSNRQGSIKKKRAYSVDNNNKGLFLKMVFPVGNTNKTKKKNIVVLNSSSSKGSSTTNKSEANGKTSKSAEKYWSKKRFSISSESDSSSHSRSNTSSSSSSISSSRGSTNARERRNMLTSCMTCFHSSKKQSAE